MNTALKVAFIQKRKRQIVVAREIGMDETHLSKIVNGHVDATPDEKRLIARALRAKVNEVFPASEEVA